MSEPPLVSVIIPTHYRNEQLPVAIESAINQTYEPIEIIVVDDSGERHAEAVCRDYDVTYIAHETNRGGNPARNTGFMVASGKYIQFLDDDDEIDETKIQKQVDLLASKPDVGVVYCGLEYEAGGRLLPKPDARGDVYHQALQLFYIDPCQTGTMLIDAAVLEEIHPLAARAAADDIGMKIRLARETQFDYVYDVLFYKGASADHRSDCLAFADEIANIIDENKAAYESAPSHVYQEAMKTRYLTRARRSLENEIWSWEAVRSYWQALQYTDDLDPILVVSFLTSWFGSPGMRVATAVHEQLLLPDNR